MFRSNHIATCNWKNGLKSLAENEAFIASGEIGQYSVSIPANRTLFWLSFPITLLTALYVLIQALAITRLWLGNPYWPVRVELANQMNGIESRIRKH